MDREDKAMLAIPVLIRQAKAQQTIAYTPWGEEIGVPNRSTWGKILAEMGRQLKKLSDDSKAWKHPRIPALGTVVVNKGKKQPELKKVKEFLPKERHCNAGVTQEQEDAFNYKHWDKVLKAFKLRHALPPIADRAALLSAMEKRHGRGGGESPEHKKLKNDVANNPGKYGFSFSKGKTERRLLSMDSLDVFFETRRSVIGVEVKHYDPRCRDLARGLFQCIKYQAVLEAEELALSSHRKVSTFLVLEQELPKDLAALANTLGVQVKTPPWKGKSAK